MNKFIVLAVASSLLASAAVAAPYGKNTKSCKSFIQLGAGYAMSKTKGNGVYNISRDIKNKGSMLDFAVGYNLNEAASISLNPMIITSFNGKETVTTNTSKSKLQYTGAFLNGRYDLSTGMMIKPFVMAGVGGIKVRSKDSYGVNSAKKTKNMFGFQGGAGVAMALQDNMDVELGYRAIGVSNRTLKYTAVNSRKLDIVHNVVAGVKYTF